jgi:drug/metabolite transporter (DMT)-like permease
MRTQQFGLTPSVRRATLPRLAGDAGASGSQADPQADIEPDRDTPGMDAGTSRHKSGAGALRPPGRDRTLLALPALVLIWGANFAVVKYALRDLRPLAFNSLRFLIASAVLGIFLAAGGERVRMERRDWPAIAGLGLLGTTLYQALFIFGLDRTLAGNASLMLAAGPVFTTFLSRLFRQERSSGVVLGGVGLSLLGIVLVVLGGSKGVRFEAATLIGDLAILVAAAAWSAYTVGSTPLVHRYGVVPVTAATMWVGTLGLAAVSLPALLAQPWTGVGPGAWLGLGYSGAFAIATAYFLWYYSVRHIGATRTAVYTNFVPVVALVVAWLALGEQPAALQLAGAAAILAGSALVHLGKVERAHASR